MVSSVMFSILYSSSNYISFTSCGCEAYFYTNPFKYDHKQAVIFFWIYNIFAVQIIKVLQERNNLKTKVMIARRSGTAEVANIAAENKPSDAKHTFRPFQSSYIFVFSLFNFSMRRAINGGSIPQSKSTG
mmetsp:Transcript_7875/g.11690  ORF Transcript_7875/g.11690 Transcript_7875/m.11690 type:complete len:130 (-) Transcript_7875:1385-1774(-)